MTWNRIRLELARSHDYPTGSHRHGYEFILPLDDGGRLDRAAYTATPELATVHRFWEGEGDAKGVLRHGGPDRWFFSFDPGEGEREPIPRLADHLFREGEYVAVREAVGGDHTFVVTLVAPARR